MRRREFLSVLGGAVLWPAVARAQQNERIRRIGALLPYGQDDPEGQARLVVFREQLQQSGWVEGRNLQIDYRWSPVGGGNLRRDAAQLVATAPEVIFANGGVTVRELQQASSTVPIVFVQVSDPVGGGLVDNLAHPGGNATGFINFEYSMSSKWLELLKQIAPRLTRAVVLRDAKNPAGTGQFGAIQAVAPSLGVEVSPINMADSGEIKRDVEAFAQLSNGGMIVTPTALATIHRQLILELAAQHHLPAVYPFRYFVKDGGLMSYGPDNKDEYRRAAGYIDRILKGEKLSNLPVQAPTKFELVISLKTAKALGLTVPQSLIATADEVIE